MFTKVPVRTQARIFYLLRVAGLLCLGLGLGKMIEHEGLWSYPVLMVLLGIVFVMTAVIWVDWRRGI
jgi:hypothetical protein